MPNGKLGDHPLSDIVVYGLAVFGPEIDAAVRELADLPGFERVRERVANLLWDNWPQWRNVNPDMPKVRLELAQIKADLTRAAE